MKTLDKKQKFIELRAKGYSYRAIAKKLNINKNTCAKWNREMSYDVERLKNEEYQKLYEKYHMNRKDRIVSIGETLNKIDDIINNYDYENVSIEKLLDLKLKYEKALKSEYILLDENVNDINISLEDIQKELINLHTRLKNGEVNEQQATKEKDILIALLDSIIKVENNSW